MRAIVGAETSMHFHADTLASRCRWLALVLGGLWVLAVFPARHFFGAAGVVASSVSAASCLFAGWLTFWLALRLSRPRMQAFGVLGGTIVRGVFAFVAAFFMQFLLGIPYENYLIWLGLFYLASLAAETALLLGPNSSKRMM